MGKSSSPKTPDYAAQAEATSKGNLDLARYTTQANRPNEITPYGSRTWTNNSTFDQAGYDAAMKAYQQSLASPASSGPTRLANGFGFYNGGASGAPRQNAMAMPNRDDFYSGGDNWTSEISLSPEMQALFDQQNKLQQGLFGAQDQALGRVNQTMGQGWDMQAYDPERDTNNAADLLMKRINPQLDRADSRLRTQLANQGVAPGSKAWNDAMAQNQYGRNDALTQAQLQGIGLGMQQQGQQFGQGAYLRNLPLNELNALRTGNQVQQPQFGGFSQQGQTAGPDYMGAANASYNAQLGNANAQNAQSSNMLSGLFGLGNLGIAAYGAGLFSDRRLKTNIKAVGKADNGLTIYSYNYKSGGPAMLGYMADEVQKVAPHAVGERGGYLTVDYSKV